MSDTADTTATTPDDAGTPAADGTTTETSTTETTPDAETDESPDNAGSDSGDGAGETTDPSDTSSDTSSPDPDGDADSDVVVDANTGLDTVHSADTDEAGAVLEPHSDPDGRADVDATTNPDGSPNSLAANPLPPDAATGDIVSQVRRGEVDGITITDAGDVADTQPGDVLVSVDPFVTIAKADAVQELRDNPGTQHKPSRG